MGSSVLVALRSSTDIAVSSFMPGCTTGRVIGCVTGCVFACVAGSCAVTVVVLLSLRILSRSLLTTEECECCIAQEVLELATES